jgi:hypothetical protein
MWKVMRAVMKLGAVITAKYGATALAVGTTTQLSCMRDLPPR